jgi:NDP-sugar pyrophosphorylase family protein
MTKVVIAAAGQGTRMLHLTDDKSKHLIEIGAKPFLSYLLDNLFVAGYRDLILVVGYKEDLMKEFVANYVPPIEESEKNDYKITLVSQFEILGPKEKEYGTACPIKCVKDIIGNDNFIYLCGDNFYSARDLKNIDIDDEFTYVSGMVSGEPEKYGVLVTKGDMLEKMVEKPKEFLGNLINVSLYRFTPEIFKKVFEINKSPRGEYEITDAINLLAKDNKVKVREIRDFWIDFGRPEDIKKCCEMLDKSKITK